MNSLSKTLKQQTTCNGNIFPMDGNIKVNVNEIDYSGTSTTVFSGVFQGNACEVAKSANGTYWTAVIKTGNTNCIVDKYGKPLFTNSTSQVSQIIEIRCENNKRIEVKEIFRPDGTLTVITINLYPYFYVFGD